MLAVRERACPAPGQACLTDDLRRSRLTVFFRLLLAIPHYFWAALIGTAVLLRVFAELVDLARPGPSRRRACTISSPATCATRPTSRRTCCSRPTRTRASTRWPRSPTRSISRSTRPAARAAGRRSSASSSRSRRCWSASALLWGGPAERQLVLRRGLAFAAAFLLWWVGVFRGRATRGPARPRRLLHRVLRAGVRLSLPAHRPLPVQRAERVRHPARGRGAAPRTADGDRRSAPLAPARLLPASRSRFRTSSGRCSGRWS